MTEFSFLGELSLVHSNLTTASIQKIDKVNVNSMPAFTLYDHIMMAKVI